MVIDSNRLPNHINRELGSFSCLKSKIVELKQGTKKVSINRHTIIWLSEKTPLFITLIREAEPETRFIIFRKKRMVALAGRWKNLSVTGEHISQICANRL